MNLVAVQFLTTDAARFTCFPYRSKPFLLPFVNCISGHASISLDICCCATFNQDLTSLSDDTRRAGDIIRGEDIDRPYWPHLLRKLYKVQSLFYCEIHLFIAADLRITSCSYCCSHFSDTSCFIRNCSQPILAYTFIELTALRLKHIVATYYHGQWHNRS